MKKKDEVNNDETKELNDAKKKKAEYNKKYREKQKQNKKEKPKVIINEPETEDDESEYQESYISEDDDVVELNEQDLQRIIDKQVEEKMKVFLSKQKKKHRYFQPQAQQDGYFMTTLEGIGTALTIGTIVPICQRLIGAKLLNCTTPKSTESQQQQEVPKSTLQPQYRRLDDFC